MAKANYSYMNSFGSLNEVKELLPFTLDRAANRALEIIHGEQSNTHGQAENEQGEREREIENVSGEPQVNFIISASSEVHIVNLPNPAAVLS